MPLISNHKLPGHRDNAWSFNNPVWKTLENGENNWSFPISRDGHVIIIENEHSNTDYTVILTFAKSRALRRNQGAPSITIPFGELVAIGALPIDGFSSLAGQVFPNTIQLERSGAGNGTNNDLRIFALEAF